MNYFEHHIGDYDEATSHLTACEDGIYSRMLRKYYATEQPLIADVTKLQRLLRAKTREEKDAVVNMLEEFFHLETDGWHQLRCDEDIAEYHAGEPEREEKRTNARERQRRARERRRALFEQLRSHNIVPPWDTKTVALESLLSRVTDAPVTEPVTRDDTATQSPDTRHQTPDTKEKKEKRVAALTLDDLVADGLSPETAVGWIAHRKAKKAPLTPLAWAGFKAEVGKAPGWTTEAAVLKAIARNWTGFEAEWVAREPQAGRQQTTGETDWQRSQRERVEQMTGGLVSAKPPGASRQTVLEEVTDVSPRTLG